MAGADLQHRSRRVVLGKLLAENTLIPQDSWIEICPAIKPQPGRSVGRRGKHRPLGCLGAHPQYHRLCLELLPACNARLWAVTEANSRMPDENSQRIDKQESHLAYLEHQFEQLNGVLIEQGKLMEPQEGR